jgi:hypothetical protein
MSAMYPWERMRSLRDHTQVTAPVTTFTPEEHARLVRLRLHLQSRAVDLELGLDERRLRFARWLVEHGNISEGVQAS